MDAIVRIGCMALGCHRYINGSELVRKQYVCPTHRFGPHPFIAKSTSTYSRCWCLEARGARIHHRDQWELVWVPREAGSTAD